MKKYIIILALFVVMAVGTPVFAMQYLTSDLIAANEVATVETEMFTYTDFSYSPTVAGKKYGSFNFKSITNKTEKSAPVSIDILLFDSKKENIGFVTYCTDGDPDGDYSHFKLGAGKSTPFHINVVNRYFVAETGPTDVAYFAVLDDNPYCHVGGYEKYAGLTIEEISSGSVVIKTDDGESFEFNQELFNSLMSASVIALVFGIIGALIGLAIQGAILNALYKRMYATTSTLAYIPIANQYIATKLAFGSSVAKIYLIAYFVSVPIAFFLPFILYIVSFVGTIAFIIDIVKLITKKYDLCYFEPFQSNNNVAVGGGFKLDSRAKEGTVDISTPVADANKDSLIDNEEKLDLSYSDSDNKKESLLDEEEKVDISYDNNIPTDGFSDSQIDDNNQSGFDMSDFSNFSDNSLPDRDPEDNKVENKEEGESELMGLFK